MIIPDTVAEAVATLLNTNKLELGIESAGEIGEEVPSTFEPPYIGLYIDTVEESQGNLHTKSIAVPFELVMLIVSAQGQTVQESSSAAWTIAFKTFKLVTETAFTIDGSKFVLQPRSQPFQILKKTAAESVVTIRCRFHLNKWE
ncbi:MAG: hypothetical protein EPO24_07750 [Bacteroidetes bacterium]|nr:MAG: hypothetical protein EPO24_07750 [Bacteroidota bacterium]